MSRWMVAIAWLPALGPGLLSVAFGLAVLADAPAPEWIAVLVVILAWVAIARRGGLGGAVPDAEPTSGSRLATALMLLAVSSAVAVFVRTTAAMPEGGWDAMAIWNYKARLLAQLGHGAGEVLSMEGAGGTDYPLGLPAAIGAVWRLMGDIPPAVPQVVACIYLLGTLAMTWCVVATWSTRTHAALATAVLAATPVVPNLAAIQYADVPVAWGVLAAAWGLATRAPLAGLALGLLCWTKNDGAALALVIVCVRGISGVKALFRPAVILGALAPVVVFAWHKLAWAPTSQIIEQRSGLLDRLMASDRWGPVLRGFADELQPFSGQDRFGLTWLLVCACLLAAPSMRGSAPSWMGRLALVGVVFWLVVLVAVPRPMPWQWDTAGYRLIAHLLPVAVAWAGCRLVRVEDGGPGDRPTPDGT